MELLVDVGPMESRFGLFGDGVSVVQDRCTVLRQMYQRHRNSFRRTQWNS
jgi:hypothetical protein